MIEISGLEKWYGGRRAVGPLSFTIEKGEVVGLLGLNGAGKTTTLRILACDLLPSTGTVRVDGLDVVERPDDVRARIGYLPDVPPLYGDMTVRDFLSFAARLRGVPRSALPTRLAEAISATQLGDVAEDPIASLSHGYKQRVGIAQAMVHKPALLVLDEPISGLDPVQIVEMRELIRRLRGEHTILVSSHILSEISETCDRILVIRDGAIAASGTEAELTASLASFRVEATLAPADGSSVDDVAALARSVDGVTSAEATAAPSGELVTLRVDAAVDVRAALAAAIVRAGHGLLEQRRSERELEAVFLELAGPGGKPRSSDRATSAAEVSA